MQLAQALGERAAVVRMHGAIGDVGQAIAGHVDDAPAGVPQAGVQPQEAHGRLLPRPDPSGLPKHPGVLR